MPVYPTGFSGEAVVPCSHCNAGEHGPDPGICHRNPFGDNSADTPACSRCVMASNGSSGVLDTLAGSIFYGLQTPCRFCNGKGYIKV
jgi:hypothetical protein